MACQQVQIAGWLTAAWAPVFLQGTIKPTSGKWAATSLPQWAAGQNVSGNWGGSTDVVLNSSKNKIAAYELAKFILDKQFVPIIGKGKARWNNVHVGDLSDVYLLLAEAAVAGKDTPGLWGGDVYYLTENGEHIWGDLARLIGKRAHELGYTGALKEDSLSKDAALEQAGFEAVSWGWNSRGKAERARKVVGWKPHRCSIEEEVDEILKNARARLQSSK